MTSRFMAARHKLESVNLEGLGLDTLTKTVVRVQAWRSGMRYNEMPGSLLVHVHS
jgi:hypothetical protein